MNPDKPNDAAPDPAWESSAGFSHDEFQKKAIAEGVRRIEDIIKGRTAGLTERQFREALR